MGSSSSGGGSSSSATKSVASTIANSVLGPAGGAIVSGLGSLASSAAKGTSSPTASSPGLSSSQQQSISRLQEEYNKAMAIGDTASANSYHYAANQIRNQAGLRAGVDYNEETGEMYGGQGANVSPSTPIISQAAYPVTQQQTDTTKYINELKTEGGPVETPALVDDSARGNEVIKL